MPRRTSIRVQRETRELLRALTSDGRTYDEVIFDLVRRGTLAVCDARWNRILDGERFVPL